MLTAYQRLNPDWTGGHWLVAFVPTPTPTVRPRSVPSCRAIGDASHPEGQSRREGLIAPPCKPSIVLAILTPPFWVRCAGKKAGILCKGLAGRVWRLPETSIERSTEKRGSCCVRLVPSELDVIE